MGAVKKSGKNSNQCGIGRSKIDRTGNYKTVCFFKFRRQFIYDVIKNTFSKLVAALTGNAAPDLFMTYPHDLDFHAFLFEDLFHFFQSKCCISLCPGTSVKH